MPPDQSGCTKNCFLRSSEFLHNNVEEPFGAYPYWKEKKIFYLLFIYLCFYFILKEKISLVVKKIQSSLTYLIWALFCCYPHLKKKITWHFYDGSFNNYVLWSLKFVCKILSHYLKIVGHCVNIIYNQWMWT